MDQLTLGKVLATLIINAGMIAVAFLLAPLFINSALSWHKVYFNWKARRKARAFLKSAHENKAWWKDHSFKMDEKR